MTTEPLQVGDQPRLAGIFSVYGTPTNPTTTKFKWRTPAGVEDEYVYGTDVELVRDSTGNFHVDLLLDESGLWLCRWVGTGACTSADEFSLSVEASAFTDPD